ncbi:aminotransferase class V-fold PLP-dependent enzyme [Frankia sp. CNm7]|nr:aminotransferase class V-fold PLP-dependent enzyme [Frankia nepalensis]
MLPVVGGDLDIPLVGGSQARHANLDYAASAPSLVTVAAEVARLLPYSASVHRGAGFASQVCTSVYEGARAEVARFLGARPDDAVIFTRNTTDAVNLLARAVAHLPGSDLGGPPAGPRVVVLDLEHHANLLPWSGPNLTVLAARPTQAETLDALAAALRAQPAALVAVTGASNVTGERLPLADVVRIAHGAGARVFVDAAQLAPHRRIDLAALGIDYLALSGHKLYAPFGAGVLVGGRAGSQTTIQPAAGSPTVVRGPAPAIPSEVPAAASGPPLQLRYVDTPRLLTLTDAQRDEIDAHCAPEAARLIIAVADRWGVLAFLTGDYGAGMCRTFNGPAAVPDLTDINGPILWSGDRHDLTKPPTSPVEVFSSGGDGSGGPIEWNARQWAVGQVSPQVALLVAALPTTDAVVVPFEPSTGAFIVRIQVTAPNFAQFQAIGQMPLTLYAYSSAGELLARSTATMCNPVPVCGSAPEVAQTRLPSPSSAVTATATSSMGGPADPATPAAG